MYRADISVSREVIKDEPVPDPAARDILVSKGVVTREVVRITIPRG